MGKLLALTLICLLILAKPQSVIRGSLATITIVNNCDQTVWPGSSSNAGIAPLEPTGFALQQGESKVLNAPSSWGGHIWGRTNCSDDSYGKFTCGTGDCGSGKMECTGAAPTPPATLAEFTLGGHGMTDYFDVSLVDGYNLAIMVGPSGGTGNNCTYTGCMVDLKSVCPLTLKPKVMNFYGEGVVCKSPCVAFGQHEYCCSGAYGTPDTCTTSSYSRLLKATCPRAFSYAYDDKTSTFACTAGTDYQVTFCPSASTCKQTGADTTGNNNTFLQSPYIRAVIGLLVVIAVIILGVGSAYTLRILDVNICNGSCNGF